MTDAELDAIEARAADATPGPWSARRDGAVWQPGDMVTMAGAVATVTDPTHPSAVRDAAFIAAARADVPALVSALREARAACREAAVALTPKHLNADDCPGCGEPMLGDGNTGDGPALFGHWAECRLAGAWLMLRKVDPTLLDWMNDGK
jgi:hypothetical protein